MSNDNKGTYCRVLTNSGWVSIDTIEEGNEVIGKDGKLVKVIGVETTTSDDAFEVIFNDGTDLYLDHTVELSLLNFDPDLGEDTIPRTAKSLSDEIYNDKRELYQLPPITPYADDHPHVFPIPPTVLIHLLMEEGQVVDKNLEKVFMFYGMDKYSSNIRYIPPAYTYESHETRQVMFDAVASLLSKDEFGNPIGLTMPSRTMALSFVELARFLGHVCTSTPIEDDTQDLSYCKEVVSIPRLITFYNNKKIVSVEPIRGAQKLVTLMLEGEDQSYLTDAHVLIKSHGTPK